MSASSALSILVPMLLQTTVIFGMSLPCTPSACAFCWLVFCVLYLASLLLLLLTRTTLWFLFTFLALFLLTFSHSLPLFAFHDLFFVLIHNNAVSCLLPVRYCLVPKWYSLTTLLLFSSHGSRALNSDNLICALKAGFNGTWTWFFGSSWHREVTGRMTFPRNAHLQLPWNVVGLTCFSLFHAIEPITWAPCFLALLYPYAISPIICKTTGEPHGDFSACHNNLVFREYTLL